MKKDTLSFIVLVVLVAGLITASVFFRPAELGVTEVRAFIDQFGAAAALIFIAVYALAAVAFLPGSLFTVVGGALFGLLGVVYVVIGATIGATLSFLLARWLGEPFVRRVLKERFERIYAYNEQLETHGFATVLLLRLIPILPFNGLNLTLGLTRVPFIQYVLATAIGIIPGAFVFTFLGNSIAQLNVVNVVIAIALVAILSGIYPLYRMFKPRTGTEYDVIIIGAGAAGLNIASFMNRAGFRVLLVTEDEESVGGDCLNTGCVPSKALIHAARRAAHAKESEQFGFGRAGQVDWKAVKQYIGECQDKIRDHENVTYLREQGIDIAVGRGRFTGKQEVAVNETRYTGQKIVIATGSRPRELSVPGQEQVDRIHTNETIFDALSFPDKLVVIGGGPIGCEIGQAFNDLGADVTIIDRGDRVLSKEDPEVSQVMREYLERQGIHFLFSRDVVRFESGDVLVVQDQEGNEETIPFTDVFVSIGRVTDFSGMDLQAAGIEQQDNGQLVLDNALRTTNPRVVASGDAAGGLQFTHATELHAQTLIGNFFRPFRRSVDTRAFAWVTYTHPEVATFGRTAADLDKNNISYTTLDRRLSFDDRAVIEGYEKGLIRIHVHGDTILGGTIVAPQAGEMVQELILATKKGISPQELIEKTYPYPVASRAQKAVLGEFVMQQKLTGAAKRVLHFLYRLFA